MPIVVQCVDKVVDVPVVQMLQFIDGLDVAVIMQRQVRAVEVPQIQFIDRVLDLPVVHGDVVPTVLLCRGPSRSHWCCSFDKVDDTRCCTTTGAWG